MLSVSNIARMTGDDPSWISDRPNPEANQELARVTQSGKSSTTCSLCDGPIKARGYCNAHYARLRRYGDPLGTPNFEDLAVTYSDGGMRRNARRGECLAFLQNIPETDECILWPFYVNPDTGYGRVHFEGWLHNAHRAALILSTGQNPTKMDAAHACRNRTCINPRHTSWKSRGDNNADKLRDGTHNRGEKHYNSKFTDAQVLVIRRDPRPNSVIAEEHGVHPRTIGMIKERKNWAWLDS